MVETLIQGKYKKYKTCCPHCDSSLSYKWSDVKFKRIICPECGKKVAVYRKKDSYYALDEDYYW